MRHRLFLLALLAVGCGPGDKSSASTDTGSSTAASTTTGTTADVTGTSTGTSTGTTGAPTTGTTGVVPDSNCRTQADCMESEQCEPHGSVQCGGATGCELGGSECADDPACGGTPESPQICVPDPCCAQSFCQPGCLVDGDCPLAQACGPDGRCAAASCDAAMPCPANFGCMANFCAPLTCTSDDECVDHCVNGLCSAYFGTCMAPAP
jgi:hypothetical protein